MRASRAALPEPFVLRWRGSGPGGEGARWWNEAMWTGAGGPQIIGTPMTLNLITMTAEC